MKTSITIKEIWKISYPIILGYLIQNIITVTDTAFLGHVGEIELGASVIGGIFYLILIMLGFGFSIGAQIIIARRCGENRKSEIGSILEHSHYFLITTAILIIITITPFIPKLLSEIINSEIVLGSTNEFLSIRIYGLFFAYINFGFRAFFIGIAKTKVITYTTILMAITNIFFDYALIFGNMGFLEYGIGGAAIASVMSEIIACIFFIIYTLKFIDFGTYNIFKFKRIDINELQQVFKVALPIMIQYLVALLGWFSFFIFVEKLGAHSLAISNIIRSIYVVTLIPMWGFASATNTFVSFLIGKEREKEVIPLIIKIGKLSLIGLLILISFNLIAPEKILSIYTNDLSLISDATPVLNIISVAAFFMTFGFILFNGVSGTGMTKITLVIESLVMLIYIIGIYTLVHIPGIKVEYVWTIEILYGILLGSISYAYLKSGRWKFKPI